MCLTVTPKQLMYLTKNLHEHPRLAHISGGLATTNAVILDVESPVNLKLRASPPASIFITLNS